MVPADRVYGPDVPSADLVPGYMKDRSLLTIEANREPNPDVEAEVNNVLY